MSATDHPPLFNRSAAAIVGVAFLILTAICVYGQYHYDQRREATSVHAEASRVQLRQDFDNLEAAQNQKLDAIQTQLKQLERHR